MWTTAALLLTLPACAAAGAPPNVVVVYADDLGFGDPGFAGHPSNLTPNLDALRATGTRLSSWYSACPVSRRRLSSLRGAPRRRSPAEYPRRSRGVAAILPTEALRPGPRRRRRRRRKSAASPRRRRRKRPRFRASRPGESGRQRPPQVCTGSRAALMTGRIYSRIGLPGVLGPTSQTGLPLRETTLADQFKKAGYATGMIGKQAPRAVIRLRGARVL